MFAKIHVAEIPWKDGLPIGLYDLVHSSSTYKSIGFGYRFVNGKTAEPISGRTIARLLMSHGSEYTVYAHDAETVAALSLYLRGRGAVERADELDALLNVQTAPIADAAPEPVDQPADDIGTADTEPPRKARK